MEVVFVGFRCLEASEIVFIDEADSLEVGVDVNVRNRHHQISYLYPSDRCGEARRGQGLISLHGS